MATLRGGAPHYAVAYLRDVDELPLGDNPLQPAFARKTHAAYLAGSTLLWYEAHKEQWPDAEPYAPNVELGHALAQARRIEDRAGAMSEASRDYGPGRPNWLSRQAAAGLALASLLRGRIATFEGANDDDKTKLEQAREHYRAAAKFARHAKYRRILIDVLTAELRNETLAGSRVRELLVRYRLRTAKAGLMTAGTSGDREVNMLEEQRAVSVLGGKTAARQSVFAHP